MPQNDHLFLTGGTGFFGTAILRQLRERSQPHSALTVLSRSPERFARLHPRLAEQAAWLKGDVLDSVGPFTEQSFTHMLHAAAESTSVTQLTHRQRFEQIVQGTCRMLDFAVEHGARRFLLTSSGGVYGRQPAGLEALPEDYLGMPDPMNPGNVYSVAKRAAEHLCALYAEEYGIEIVVARCFAFVGQDLPLNVHFAIGNFIRDALCADEIVVNGDGTPVRSYLDQRDLARWLMALLHEGKAGEAYNVGSDQAISIADLAHLVRDLVSPGKPVRVLGRPVDNAERNRYVPDISKIGRDLGLRPSFSLEQSILDAAAAVHRRGRVDSSGLSS